MRRADIHVAAAAGMSVYLPLYWMATTLTDACGNPEPLTAFNVLALLLTLACYLLAPLILSLLSRFPLAARTPRWLSVPFVGSGILVPAYIVTLGATRLTVTVEGVFVAWLGLSLWTMPASAAVYYFGAAVGRAKRWHGGPHYEALGLRK